MQLTDNAKRRLALAGIGVGGVLILAALYYLSEPGLSPSPAPSDLHSDEPEAPLPPAEALGIVLPAETSMPGTVQADSSGPASSANRPVSSRWVTPRDQEEAEEIRRLEAQGIVVY